MLRLAQGTDSSDSPFAILRYYGGENRTMTTNICVQPAEVNLWLSIILNTHAWNLLTCMQPSIGSVKVVWGQ